MQKFYKSLVFIFVGIFLVSCGITTTQPVNIDDSTSIPPSLIPSSTPTKIYTHTTTWTPYPTITLTPTVTWTPLPTLPAQEAQARVKELLETNGGCELPCWWGTVPNHTPWSEALHFLTPMITHVGQGGSVNYFEDGIKHVATNYGIEFDVDEKTDSASIYFDVNNDIVSSIMVFPPSTEYRYQLHQLLALLGRPDQIFISAQQSSPIPDLPPTVIILDYSDVGVWASYGYTPILVEEILSICPHPIKENIANYKYPNVGGRLYLFDSNRNCALCNSIEEYADMVGGFTARKLEDVTNMNIELFYKTFSNRKSNVCIETPADLWP